MDAEKLMISKLKAGCGGNFTANIEGMFRCAAAAAAAAAAALCMCFLCGVDFAQNLLAFSSDVEWWQIADAALGSAGVKGGVACDVTVCTTVQQRALYWHRPVVRELTLAS
jgi:hypothetical protein